MLTSLFLLPYNDILNPGPNIVKFDGILGFKSGIEYIYRDWLNEYIIHNSGGCKESPLQKSWKKYVLVRIMSIYWYDMFSRGRLTFVYMLNIYSILSTNMMCLAKNKLNYVACVHKIEVFHILLQNCYFMINLMKKGWQFPCLWLWNFDVSNYWW